MDGIVKILLGFTTLVIIVSVLALLGVLGGSLELFGSFLMYMLPTVVAYLNNHKKFTLILLVNFFLGWTVIAWVWMLLVALDIFRKGRLDVTIQNKPRELNTMDILEIIIKNVSPTELHDIRLELNDEFVTQHDRSYSIKAGESEMIKLPIRAMKSGQIPLKVKLTYRDVLGESITQSVEEIFYVTN